jgi:sugar transferase (PEP-CTERM/EpsH1 system associated)
MMREILFLSHRVPFPPDRGDKIRAHHVLKHLAARARVHLATFADVPGDMGHDDWIAHYCASHQVIFRDKSRARAAAEALATGRPVSLTAFAHPAMRHAVARMLAAHPIDTIHIYSSQMAQYLPASFEGRVVMDFCDMDSAKFTAYADGEAPPMAWLMRREGRLLEAFDRGVADRADASLFVSEAEAALFRDRTGAPRVSVMENGIDTEFYDPSAAFPPQDVAGPLIVFTGQMDYRPNIDAVTWFARRVLPGVRGRHPSARFAIVGRAPTDVVRALAQQPGVTVTGEVPDVRGWLAAAQVVVAPLMIARGVQNKVLEAMAMARPVVASTAAAEGIDHGGTIRVAGDAGAFIAATLALIADPGTIGQAARARVQARYGWAARLAPLDALLGLEAQRRDAA